jgi:hypothetical protein
VSFIVYGISQKKFDRYTASSNPMKVPPKLEPISKSYEVRESAEQFMRLATGTYHLMEIRS